MKLQVWKTNYIFGLTTLDRFTIGQRKSSSCVHTAWKLARTTRSTVCQRLESGYDATANNPSSRHLRELWNLMQGGTRCKRSIL
jgi:hypothetical protein